jgi:hypothetical protein
MEFANMIPADLTPSELAQKMEARWELLESMFQRIFDSIEDAKVLTPCSHSFMPMRRQYETIGTAGMHGKSLRHAGAQVRVG